ncbi:RNA polymerase sigma-70 factor (ECF subfamily) [Kineococcus radiotolerans]|uniref:RNA polymerase sigma-70 factor (ECF subfamily) n=1 Tax=Kineococcus radiotolerans TaxID=131568 RepID=A0A7W4TMW2_KINRA|nr:sigma-70 family RNA polymerase sigma factor [Kineococcus radiotolerans]MBB2901422.1 RNA polymerase sigma-70 factor (ECF subfamily) [Kineococcus radiotolerans]
MCDTQGDDVRPPLDDDAALARAAAMGDRDAFAGLVERHGPSLYRYAHRLLRDPGRTDDCVQETFLAAWRALPRFRGDASVRTWLFTICRHEVYARSRDGGAHEVDLDTVRDRIQDLRADPARAGVEAALRDALDLALGVLPPRQRSAWLLREVEGLSYDEIAEVLGTTAAAVRGLLERARTALATALEGWQ